MKFHSVKVKQYLSNNGLSATLKAVESYDKHDCYSSKWTDHEIEMLQTAVNRFSEDLYKLTEVIKSRTL